MATLGGFSKKVVVFRGCPKRDVLSPLLWLLVDYFIARLNRGEIHTQCDADDACLLAVREFPNTVTGLIQWALHSFEMWCDKIGLSVNPEKTELIVFTRRRTPWFL